MLPFDHRLSFSFPFTLDDSVTFKQRHRRHWTRQTHARLFNRGCHYHSTNVLFAALLLGLLRLETMGVLTLAHHSTVEDIMLEGWTVADNIATGRPW